MVKKGIMGEEFMVYGGKIYGVWGRKIWCMGEKNMVYLTGLKQRVRQGFGSSSMGVRVRFGLPHSW